MRSLLLSLLFCLAPLFAEESAPAKTETEQTTKNFIIDKKKAVKKENLSKDAIKERMGEAVRDGMHALFDSAEELIKLQQKEPSAAKTACLAHTKVLGLQRKMSRIAESLLDSHFTYKKNHKKRLEQSLELLTTCVADVKKTNEEFKSSLHLESKKTLDSAVERLAGLESKLAADICLKHV